MSTVDLLTPPHGGPNRGPSRSRGWVQTPTASSERPFPWQDTSAMPTYVNGNRLDPSWNERFSSRRQSSILQPLEDSGSEGGSGGLKALPKGLDNTVQSGDALDATDDIVLRKWVTINKIYKFAKIWWKCLLTMS